MRGEKLRPVIIYLETMVYPKDVKYLTDTIAYKTLLADIMQ